MVGSLRVPRHLEALREARRSKENTTMPFIGVKLDAKEATLAPEGKTGEKSKIPGEPMLEVMIVHEGSGPDGENYAPIFHTLMIPTGKTPEKNVEMYKLNIQRFLHMFNIKGDSDGFDTDDFPGATAKDVAVTQEEGDDEVTRNKIKLERLPEGDEPQGGGATRGAARGSAAGGPRGRRRG
jgi:hypothetical protein